MTERDDAARAAQIRFEVRLDADDLPVSIEWDATDSQAPGAKPARAVMLSVWDHDEKRAMAVDLWTRDMLADEMKLFVFQTLMTMADTLERATSERERAQEIREFASGLAGRLGFVRKGEGLS